MLILSSDEDQQCDPKIKIAVLYAIHCTRIKRENTAHSYLWPLKLYSGVVSPICLMHGLEENSEWCASVIIMVVIIDSDYTYTTKENLWIFYQRFKPLWWRPQECIEHNCAMNAITSMQRACTSYSVHVCYNTWQKDVFLDQDFDFNLTETNPIQRIVENQPVVINIVYLY